MYQPPPGRPISTPPDDAPAAESQKRTRGPNLTVEQIAALRADYIAGMPIKEIEAKHGVRGGGFHRYFKDLSRRRGKTTALATDKPPRNPGEPSHAYARRVLQWRIDSDPEYAQRVYDRRTKARLKTLHRKKLKAARAEQKRLVQTSRDIMATAFDPAQVRSDNWQVVVRPPSLWQRIVGWFR